MNSNKIKTIMMGDLKDIKKTYSLYVLPVFEDFSQDDIAITNEDIKKILFKIIELKDFEGKEKSKVMLYTPDSNIASKILLIGLGKRTKITSEKIRITGGIIGEEARKCKCKDIVVDMTITGESNVNTLVEGIILGVYKFEQFKKPEKNSFRRIENLSLVGNFSKEQRDINKNIILANSVNYARDLGISPANIITPEYLTEEAKKIAKKGEMKLQIFNRSEIKKAGLNGIEAVARSSANPPYFIIMEYFGKNKSNKPVGIVGKGITFDSGGLNIKPSNGLMEMKMDMCGAAVILAVMNVVSKLKPDVNIVAAIPVAENALGGKSYRPGDIIKMYNGKYVEIHNTDAEGRLLLADALAYLVKNYNPSHLLDIATLTGAVLYALGTAASAVISNNKVMINKIKKVADITGEKVWELPIYEEYTEAIKSEIADLKNIGTRGEASISTAAAFLQEFVGKIPWVHIDIAGVAWGKTKKSYNPSEVTGYGVRLLYNYLINI